MQRMVAMPITKWKNIMLEPDESKRNKKIDKLTEADAKDFLKFLTAHVLNYSPEPKESAE